MEPDFEDDELTLREKVVILLIYCLIWLVSPEEMDSKVANSLRDAKEEMLES